MREREYERESERARVYKDACRSSREGHKKTVRGSMGGGVWAGEYGRGSMGGEVWAGTKQRPV